ncbi:MAG TPA: DUF459 domain-containing protein [Alphaproteobacteria bacterium]|nr:DUF459 domain-containing protein [Alphaproteobacteria bacterium]
MDDRGPARIALGIVAGGVMLACVSARALPGEEGPRPQAADDDVFTVAVIGDSLADGIWGGLYRQLQRDPEFDVLRFGRNSTGLARPDYFDWPAELRKIVTDFPVDAVVIALGLNDNQEVWIDGRRSHDFATPEWNQVYVERVDAMMGFLAETDIPTFWIGLPVMRDDELSDQIRHINAILEVRAMHHDIPFVPLWDLTAGEDGGFVSYLKDEDGRSRPMRKNDGIHFTGQGYTMLADEVLEVMQVRLPGLAEDITGD